MVDVRTVWMCATPEVIRERMIRRGAERDHTKLADWAAYRTEVLDSGIGSFAKEVVDIIVQN
ncbi:hypothetical protein [Nocardia sp. IFM 10818]